MDSDEEVEALRAGVSLALRRPEPDLDAPWYGTAGPRSALGPVGELRLVLAGHDGATARPSRMTAQSSTGAGAGTTSGTYPTREAGVGGETKAQGLLERDLT